MKLTDWMVDNNYTQGQFAEKANMGRSHLSDVIRGARPPSRRIADSIEEATEGDITAIDVMTGKALGYSGRRRRVSKEGIPKKPLAKKTVNLL